MDKSLNSHAFIFPYLKLVLIAEFGSSGGFIYLHVMKKNRNNHELQTRREFFKKAAKGTLPILGFMAFGPIVLSSCGDDDDNNVSISSQPSGGDGSWQNPYTPSEALKVANKLKEGETTDEIIINSYDVDLKEKWFSYRDSKNLVGSRFYKKNKDVSWIIQNVCTSDSTLLFNTNQSEVYRIDLRNNSGDSHTELINDKSYYNTTWLIPYGGIYKSVIRAIPPLAIKDAIENHFVHEGKISDSLMKSIVNSDYGDNPLLEIFQIK